MLYGHENFPDKEIYDSQMSDDDPVLASVDRSSTDLGTESRNTGPKNHDDASASGREYASASGRDDANTAGRDHAGAPGWDHACASDRGCASASGRDHAGAPGWDRASASDRDCASASSREEGHATESAAATHASTGDRIVVGN